MKSDKDTVALSWKLHEKLALAESVVKTLILTGVAGLPTLGQTAPYLVTPDLQFDKGDWPIALELVWHKQRPCGPAASWLRERFAAERVGSLSGGERMG